MGGFVRWIDTVEGDAGRADEALARGRTLGGALRIDHHHLVADLHNIGKVDAVTEVSDTWEFDHAVAGPRNDKIPNGSQLVQRHGIQVPHVDRLAVDAEFVALGQREARTRCWGCCPPTLPNTVAILVILAVISLIRVFVILLISAIQRSLLVLLLLLCRLFLLAPPVML